MIGILHFIFYLLLITILGLLIAFSPMLVIVNTLVVLKSKRPILRTIVLMLGMALPLLLVAALAILFLDPQSNIGIRNIAEKINIPPLINLLFGLWLLGWAWRRRQHSLTYGPKKTANLILKKPPDSYKNLFIFAFVKSTLSVTNLFAVLVVAKLIITTPINQPLATLTVLWVILIGLIPFGAILYFYFFKHAQLEKLSAQVDRMLNRNIDVAINLTLMAVGIFFAAEGLFELIRR